MTTRNVNSEQWIYVLVTVIVCTGAKATIDLRSDDRWKPNLLRHHLHTPTVDPYVPEVVHLTYVSTSIDGSRLRSRPAHRIEISHGRCDSQSTVVVSLERLLYPC